MRLLLSAVAAVALLSSQASFAAGCSPAAKTAFDVEGLKSELMVTALSCGMQAKYNAFMERFRPEVAQEEGELTAYFKQAYGREAQSEHDAYITQLANVQSEQGLRMGTAFCQQNGGMLSEVQYLTGPSEMSWYASGKDIVQPAGMCVPGAVREVSATTERRTTEHHAVVRKPTREASR